jgi:hypothetical protein
MDTGPEGIVGEDHKGDRRQEMAGDDTVGRGPEEMLKKVSEGPRGGGGTKRKDTEDGLEQSRKDKKMWVFMTVGFITRLMHDNSD